MGFKPGKASAALAGLSEAGGARILVGVATPVTAAGAAAVMVAAVAVPKPAGFFSTAGGYEYPGVLGLAAAALALTGPGRYSIDALTRHRFNTNTIAAATLTAAGIGAGAVVRRRRKLVPAPSVE